MPDLPRPEYPRPDFVRDRWLNLNGPWDFTLDPGRSGESRGLTTDGPYSDRLLVPFCPESTLSGLGWLDFMPCVWYRRTFTLPADWAGSRVLLHFGAVDYEATVWLNGALLGAHRGGYTPFSFDLTDQLQPGENLLVVRAVDDTRDPLQPSGKQSPRYESYGCMYTRTTGIWQTVWLEPVPQTYLSRVRLVGDTGHWEDVSLQVSIEGDTTDLHLKAQFHPHDPDLPYFFGGATAEVRWCVELAEFRPWTPDDPFLYDLELSLWRKGTEQVDSVRTYYGARQVQVRGDRLLLNGQPLCMRLVLDQGFYPDGLYTAPSDEALRADLERSLALGFNGARLHQKVFEPRFLYWADKLGYLVWGEYADWGLDTSRPEALRAFLPQWLEAVARDCNHPALIGWCPFNETPAERDPELLRTVYRVTRAVDPTRPVIDTSGYHHVETDLYDSHNYEQDPAKFAATLAPFRAGGPPFQNDPGREADYAGQPYFVSEYGGIWWNPGQRDDEAWGYGDRPRTEAEFLARYAALTGELLSHPRLCGFCYTQLYDVEQEVNGLYTYDRRPKFDPAPIAEINCQEAATQRD